MTLSSDELEILDYLRSWKGEFVSMVEICRCAGGRRKFRESPNWANSLMTRLVEANLIQVNDRGHYRFVKPAHSAPRGGAPARRTRAAMIVGDNYFPATSEDGEEEQERWVSPDIAAMLKRSGSGFGGQSE